MNCESTSFRQKEEAEAYRNELDRERPLCPLIKDTCDVLCRFHKYSRVITCGDGVFLVKDVQCTNPMFTEPPKEHPLLDFKLGQYLSKDEFIEILETAIHDSFWSLFTNGTSLPSADFYESVKQGVKEAHLDLGK